MNTENFSLKQIDELSSGDKDFKKEVVQIFKSQIPEFIANMNKFFANNDYDNLAKEAHTAKSSVLIFGMVKTGSDLKKIQKLAEENSLTGIPLLIDQVRLELKTVAANLEIILKELSS